jgi:hypothetical protein
MFIIGSVVNTPNGRATVIEINGRGWFTVKTADNVITKYRTGEISPNVSNVIGLVEKIETNVKRDAKRVRRVFRRPKRGSKRRGSKRRRSKRSKRRGSKRSKRRGSKRRH